jgi:hypothetical protein
MHGAPLSPIQTLSDDASNPAGRTGDAQGVFSDEARFYTVGKRGAASLLKL